MLKRRNNAEIVILADEHIGSPQHTAHFLDKAIRYIKHGTNRFWIYLGDGIENNLEGSAGSPLTQTMSPEDQMETFIKKHRPIRKKCIAFNTTSNHSARTTKKTSINPDKLLADKLNMPYTHPTDTTNIQIGDRTFNIMHTHGSSGATTMAGKMRVLNNYANNYNSDIFLHAHVHTLLQWHQWKVFENRYKQQSFMIAGSFLDYFDGYGQVKNYTPYPAQFGSIILTEDGVEFKAFTDSSKLSDKVKGMV